MTAKDNTLETQVSEWEEILATAQNEYDADELWQLISKELAND